ncbi:Proline dehydrogenase 1 [Halalkalibacter krulwichiae]|uniref:proline dehydrogenase n=2 Tax=Halalkalibacter krulwichiae TaxID=199441 RepID=A0A1X9MGT1_9BACI|nr:Proline dehydrogenase 1 [Halalkalibacter krulwichiae]
MMALEKISRSFFLSLSKNKVLNIGAKKWGLGLGASQVVAGTTIESMIKTVSQLNNEGLLCTVDHLGEFVLSKEEARYATKKCIETLEAIATSGVNCQLSVKLTQLGLDIDDQFCLENMKEIMKVAKKFHNFVQIDMEDYSRKKATLEILAALRESYDNVGTVIQAYLYDAEDDVEMLKGMPLRLVKGAYKEQEVVAFQDKARIDNQYLRIIKKHLMNGSYTAIGSHDHVIIDKVIEFANQNGIPRTQFEFQMLYGFRTDLQKDLVDKGYTMRVYVPFGEDWYGYFMRRLAERPQNVTFALKGLLSK